MTIGIFKKKFAKYEENSLNILLSPCNENLTQRVIITLMSNSSIWFFKLHVLLYMYYHLSINACLMYMYYQLSIFVYQFICCISSVYHFVCCISSINPLYFICISFCLLYFTCLSLCLFYFYLSIIATQLYLHLSHTP